MKKLLGIFMGLFLTLALIAPAVAWKDGQCSIRITNQSKETKIYYWVYWDNPTDDDGKPMRDRFGNRIDRMNIMGGELTAGKSVESGPDYKVGNYRLEWRDANGKYPTRKHKFEILPGDTIISITVAM